MLYTRRCLVVNRRKCGLVSVLAVNVYDVLLLRIRVGGQVLCMFGRYLVIVDIFQGSPTML